MSLYRQPGMLMYWTHELKAPWQTEEWREQMREQLRGNAYARMVENRWVSTDSAFVPLEWWDLCVDPSARPMLINPKLPVVVAWDASVKRDATACVVTTLDRDAWGHFDTRRVRLVWHKIWQPTPKEPLDFESVVEETTLELRLRFRVLGVAYDPINSFPQANGSRGEV